MKLKISKIFPKAIMFIASVCLFICCERDDAELDHTLNWKAETIVDEMKLPQPGYPTGLRQKKFQIRFQPYVVEILEGELSAQPFRT